MIPAPGEVTGLCVARVYTPPAHNSDKQDSRGRGRGAGGAHGGLAEWRERGYRPAADLQRHCTNPRQHSASYSFSYPSSCCY